MMDEIGEKETENSNLEQKIDLIERQRMEADGKFKQAEQIAIIFLRSRGIQSSDAFLTISKMN